MEQIKVKSGGTRLDSFLSKHFDGAHTRSQIINAIKSGEILLNGEIAKQGAIVKTGNIITVDFKPFDENAPATPEDIPLDIVFEDNNLMIVNKARGMVTHPGNGNRSGTLLNALLFKLKGANVDRAGLVHRLDKNTAGLMVVAKTARAQERLAKMMEKHDVNRVYNGLLEGRLEGSGTINKPIIRDQTNRTIYTTGSGNGARHATTHYETLAHYRLGERVYTLAKFKLETGRTHQIRVHAKSIGHPLVGDPEYNPKSSLRATGQLLESVEISFIHPITKKEISFKINPSAEFDEILRKLKPF